MPLTTVARGRVYDWSHAIGRGAATGTGFNYVQTMALDKNGNIYTANRGNENNFGMRVNHVKVGGPHEEELLAEFFQYGEEDGKAIWPFGVAVDNERDLVYCSDEWTNTISVFDTSGKYLRKFGSTGSGDGELMRPAGLAIEKNGNLIVVDSGNNRLQVFSPEGKFVGKCGGPGKTRRVQPALGHHPRQGRQHLCRRLEEPPDPEAVRRGQAPDVHRLVRQDRRAGERLCRHVSWARCRRRERTGRTAAHRSVQSPDRCRGRQRWRHLCVRLGQPSGLRVRLRGRPDHHPDRRCA